MVLLAIVRVDDAYFCCCSFNRAQCETFYTYLAEVMGPAIVRVFGSNMHNAIEPIQEFEEFEYAVSENVDVDVDAGVDAGVEVDVKPENETE